MMSCGVAAKSTPRQARPFAAVEALNFTPPWASLEIYAELGRLYPHLGEPAKAAEALERASARSGQERSPGRRGFQRLWQAYTILHG